jgi:hypothetical protein
MINRYRMPLAERCLVFALFFATCLVPLTLWASPEKGGEAEAALGAMAEQYWTKRLVEKDYEFTYDKELEKGSLSFSDYFDRAKAAEKFRYLSVKTKKVNIEGDRGVVYLTVECIAPFMPKGHKQMLQDLWLYRSGQWRHKFSDK